MSRERRDAGMVTAELAVTIPGVLVVLALCLSALTLAVDQIRCVDAARAAARAASRGDDTSQVQQAARALTPAGTTVSVTRLRGADAVEVRVSAPPRMSWLPGVPGASALARAPLEPVARDG